MRTRNLLPAAWRVGVENIEEQIRLAKSLVKQQRRQTSTSRHSPEELQKLLQRAKEEHRKVESQKRPNEHELTVQHIERTTQNSMTITFAQDDTHPIEFLPGQFLTIIADIDGEEVRRAYSFCSDPADQNNLSISVKRVKDGQMSNTLNDQLEEGDTLRVSGPNGRFGLTPLPGTQRQIVLIAGGSGITPLHSIAHALCRAEPDTQVSLLYANRDEQQIMLNDSLQTLAAANQQFTLDYMLEDSTNLQEAETQTIYEGRINTEAFDNFHLERSISPNAEYYICGPQPMMDVVEALLETRGVPNDQIHIERFLDQSKSDHQSPEDMVEYAVTYGGQSPVMVRGGTTVLDAGIKHGADISYSCTMGGCASCKVKLISGDVVMEEPNCLSSRERREGYILACVARPRSDCSVESQNNVE